MNVETDGRVYSPPTYTSRDARPEQEIITIQTPQDLDIPFYDMTKNKYLHIFNHFEFDKSRLFGDEKPKDRHGTHFDVKILQTTFESLGFEVKVHQDLSRYNIRKAIEKLIDKDHSQTSCVALAILTHGSYDGYLFAKDEPYELKEITKLLEAQRLATIPKLLFLQVSLLTGSLPPLPWLRYRLSIWRSTVDWFTHAIMQLISVVMDILPPRPMLFYRMGSWRSSVTRFTRTVNLRISKFYSQMRNSAATTDCDAAIENDCCCNGACRGHALDKGHQVEVDGIIRNLVHVPSHIDFLILHSAADGHASFRIGEAGSWMIQSLCNIIQKYHVHLDILQMITLVNKRVAYDFTAFNNDYPSYNNKKQSLEARYTLTKFLKL